MSFGTGASTAAPGGGNGAGGKLNGRAGGEYEMVSRGEEDEEAATGGTILGSGGRR